jgi:hypothetical protein
VYALGYGLIRKKFQVSPGQRPGVQVDVLVDFNGGDQ